MFNVGDIITGSEYNNYGMTNKYALMVVLDAYDGVCNEHGRVKIIACSEQLIDIIDFSEIYDVVLEDRFEHCTPEQFEEKYQNVEIYKAKDFDKYTNAQNTEEKKMENKFVVNTKFELSEKEMEILLEEGKELLSEYDHEYTDSGMRTIFNTWASNKGNLIEAMKHHPNYVDGKYQIVFSHDYERGIDKNAIRIFVEWCKSKLMKSAKENEMKIHGMTKEEAEGAFHRLDRIYDMMMNIMSEFDRYTGTYRYRDVMVNGFDSTHYFREKERIYKTIREFNAKGYDIGRLTVDKETYNRYNCSKLFLDEITKTETHIATEAFANNANYLARQIGFDNLNAVSGQKITRIVGKFCKFLGLDKIKDVQTTFSGREKDYGYNYQFALFCDAISPLKITRHTIISANPIDYWTMSFGNSWASCQTIDGNNKRGMPHSYNGMYMSGTTSYMLDGTTLIMYTVDSEYNEKDFELQPKMQRCNFHIGEDKIIQGRVYPDGRDGGDGSLSEQFRNIMQKVVADMYDVPNMWVLKKGVGHCEQYEISEGTNYKDYECYDDCTVSLLKDENGNVNDRHIIIGHDPICPVCGCEHEKEDKLCCEDCYDDNYVTCEHCGSRIHRDDAIYCEYNGNYYCDYDCAQSDGVVYCENVDEWHHENERYVYQSDYSGEWFYDDEYEHIETEDGNIYRDYDEAESAGYISNDNNEWYPESEMHYCEHCERYVHDDDWNDELDCCTDCEDLLTAEREEENDAA